MMCWTRNKYHYSVRKAKKAANNMESNKLLEAADTGDAALFKEMKRIRDGRDIGQIVPDCLDGKVTHDTILERFKECY